MRGRDGEVKIFGMDSPAGLLRVPVPVGMLCSHCEKPLKPGDQGVFLLHVDRDGFSFRPQHRWCFLRQVLPESMFETQN